MIHCISHENIRKADLNCYSDAKYMYKVYIQMLTICIQYIFRC